MIIFYKYANIDIFAMGYKITLPEPTLNEKATVINGCMLVLDKDTGRRKNNANVYTKKHVITV